MSRRFIVTALRRVGLLCVVLGLLLGQAGLSTAASMCEASCAPGASCGAEMSSHDCCCAVSSAPGTATLRSEGSSPVFHLALALRTALAKVSPSPHLSRIPAPCASPVAVLLTGSGASRAPPFSSASQS